MKVLLIEDEENLARQLQRMLHDLDHDITVSRTTASVVESLAFLRSNPQIDLIFADIYLNDGLSFDIFAQEGCPAPIIFCTAYDQYAIKAFELDSVDYLLKPIKKEDLKKAIDKYQRLFGRESALENLNRSIHRIGEKLLGQTSYRQSFLFPHRDRLVPVGVEEISHFQASHGTVWCITMDGRKFATEQGLGALMVELDPQQFYRANRQYLVHRRAIVDVEYYFNGRLLLNIRPKAEQPILISKAKATAFKHWMG